MSCLRIIKRHKENSFEIEDLHQKAYYRRENFVEVEVPVELTRLVIKGLGYIIHATIKLKACKNCGLYVREEQDHD